jgi:hypothetical protein
VRYSWSQHAGSVLWTRGGEAYPVPTIVPANWIGDTTTANTGYTATGTGWTRSDGSSLVQSFWIGDTQATVTGITKDGGGPGIDSLAFTSPSLSLGNYAVTVVASGGQAAITGTVNVSGFDAWDPRSVCTFWFRTDYGLTYDGDDVVSWTDRNGVVCTFVVRPTVFTDVSLGGRLAINLSGGCYGTLAVPTTTTQLGKVVGYSETSGSGNLLTSWTTYGKGLTYGKGIRRSESAMWGVYDGAYLNSTVAALTRSVVQGAFTGDSAARRYVNTKIPEVVNAGAGIESILASIGAVYNGGAPWNGVITEAMWMPIPADSSTEILSMRHSAWWHSLTLGA